MVRATLSSRDSAREERPRRSKAASARRWPVLPRARQQRRSAASIAALTGSDRSGQRASRHRRAAATHAATATRLATPASQLGGGRHWHLDPQVDAVEQRAGDPAAIAHDGALGVAARPPRIAQVSPHGQGCGSMNGFSSTSGYPSMRPGKSGASPAAGSCDDLDGLGLVGHDDTPSTRDGQFGICR